jgi:hypothetical protein
MSSIPSTHFNWLPQPSAYNQMQAQRAQRDADNSDFLDTASSLAGSFSDAMSSQYDGIANLAADAAAKRLGITLPSQSSTDTTSASSSSASSTDSSSSSDSSSATASSADYMKTINQIIDGTADLTSQTQSEISSAGSAQNAIANMLDGANLGGTPSATVDQIADGTAGLANSAQNQMSSDGNMFSTIDRIINASVEPTSVNMTV